MKKVSKPWNLVTMKYSMVHYLTLTVNQWHNEAKLFYKLHLNLYGAFIKESAETY